MELTFLMFNRPYFSVGRNFISPLLILGLVLSVGVSPVYAKYSEIFSEYKINLPFSATHPPIAANLLHNPGVEILVVGIDDKQQRQFSIYGKKQGETEYSVLSHSDIIEDIIGFDLGVKDPKGLTHLYVLNKSEVKRYIPAHMEHMASWHLEQQVSSMFITNRPESLHHINFAQDINNDEQDDFVLPHFEQLNLWLTDCCGLRHAQSLPVSAQVSVNPASVGYAKKALYFVDMNQDEKTDIVVPEQGRLAVYLQNSNMQFSPKASLVSLSSSFSPLEWWDKKDTMGQNLDQSNLEHRKIHKIEDINGDDLPDIAVKFTKSSGVLDKIIDYEFFYGAASEGLIKFSETASAKVVSEDTISAMYFIDIQGDGKKEVIATTLDIGLSQIISALLAGSVDQDVMLFSMDDEQHFSEKPSLSQEIEMTFSLSSGKTGQPLTKVLDVNGDSVKDLVFSEGDNQLSVLLATPNGKKPYARWPLKQKIKIPKDASQVLSKDLNDDDKTDLILHFSKSDGADMMHQISLLIAK